MSDTQHQNDKGSLDAVSEITDHERYLAESAVIEYNKKNYKSCLEHLERLEIKRPDDPKLLLNKAIVEYFENGLCTTDKFQKSLVEIFKQIELDVENLDCLKDANNCIYYYNYAVLLYHLKHYTKALVLMNKVFSFVGYLEENLAHKVCLLTIELNRISKNYSKVLELIVYSKKQFISTEHINLTVDPEDQLTLSSITGINKDEIKQEKYVDHSIEAFRVSLIQYHARCLMDMNLIEDCVEQLNIIKDQKDPITLTLLGKLEYLQGNYKEALEIIKNVPMNNDFMETGESLSVLLNNNLACLYHNVKKHSLAYTFGKKAIVHHQNNISNVTKLNHAEGSLSGQPLHIIGASIKVELMFNLGICLLHQQKPNEAFDCLIEAVQMYYMNPRLWLRLAECCMMVHKQSNARDFDFKEPFVENVVGSSSIHRTIILKPQMFPDNKYNLETISASVPVPSLEFGSLCVRNAVLLLQNDQVDFSPSHVSSSEDKDYLFGCILLAGAYIALCLSDPIVALKYSQDLLKCAQINNVHKFLGHLYSAEALILLDRLPEALDVLVKSAVLEDIAPEVQKQLTLEPWEPDNKMSRMMIFYYNLAVVLTLQGNYHKASELVQRIWIKKVDDVPVPVHVILLTLYINLRSGRKEHALNLIKRFCSQAR